MLGRLLRGVLLCDFSENIDSLSLCFVPFPGGKEYRGKVRVERYFPERFRSVSINQGKICFVHIDNDFQTESLVAAADALSFVIEKGKGSSSRLRRKSPVGL